MSRVVLQVIVSMLVPAVAATAQLSVGIGPTGRALFSARGSTWETSAQFAGGARFDNPLASLDAEGLVQRVDGGLAVSGLSLRPSLFTPTHGGFRGVAALDYSHRGTGITSETQLSASTSLVYRRGYTGTWLGVRGDRGTTGALRAGAWRQVGERVTIAVSSALRRGVFGGTPSRFWTETYRDSVWSDTSGWSHFEVPRMFGDSGSSGRARSWLETEANFGTVLGRIAFDGALGWRPSVDTARHAAWARATGTVALRRNVALSLGLGTSTRRSAFTHTTGTYATVGVRLAPAALVRPNELPEITAVPAAFRIELATKGEYTVRVRLPRARTVELSGDFNGWTPVRLTRDTDDTWTASLALKPGTYRMNLRVDGEAWVPPPGTTAVADEFNGKVGLVVIR